jgi:hypothetical protein
MGGGVDTVDRFFESQFETHGANASADFAT